MEFSNILLMSRVIFMVDGDAFVNKFELMPLKLC